MLGHVAISKAFANELIGIKSDYGYLKWPTLLNFDLAIVNSQREGKDMYVYIYSGYVYIYIGHRSNKLRGKKTWIFCAVTSV